METETIAKLILFGGVGISIGPILAIVITPLFCLLRAVFYAPFIREKLRKKAIRKGHVIEATLQESYNVTDFDTEFGNTRSMEDIGVYTYDCKGKKRKYRVSTTDGFHGLPKKIKLYYIKNPKKATVSRDLGNWEVPWLKIYLSIAFIIAVVILVAGMALPLETVQEWLNSL